MDVLQDWGEALRDQFPEHCRLCPFFGERSKNVLLGFPTHVGTVVFDSKLEAAVPVGQRLISIWD